MLKLIERNTPEIKNRFVLKTIEKINDNNAYEVYCEDGKIVLAGDCKISQAMAYYDYLKRYCNAFFFHGKGFERTIDEAPEFEGKITKTVLQKMRLCFSYDTYGYSMSDWQWNEWEKEIDYLAMNGINFPLSLVGNEAVWYYTLRDFKYSETGALSFISGPGYWFKQMTDNLFGFFALTDVKYIENRVELGKKIINREVELGMTPIQQGYCGMIPNSIKKLFKSVKMSIVSSWHNFPFTFMLDAEDPLFKKFGTALLEKQKQLFGSYHYYSCAPYCDNIPNNRSKTFAWKLGRGIDRLLSEFDEKSVWVLRSDCARENMVKAVPKERLLIVDEYSKYLGYTDDFWGYNYILGMGIENKGNHTVLNGSLENLAKNKFSKSPDNCLGVGTFTAGIDGNPLYNELCFYMLTASKDVQLDTFIRDYAERRYNSCDLCLAKALEKLAKSCYSTDGRETGSVLCMRPSTELTHTSIGDELSLKYDNQVLIDGLELFLSFKGEQTEGYKYDACDIARQCASNALREIYLDAMNGYYERNVKLFERSANTFLRICDELDELLLTREEFSLSEYLKKISSLAIDEKDKENFELNLLTKISLWGPVADPDLYDCAWKEWGGMVSTYYAKRWQSFFERVAMDFSKRRTFSTVTRKQPNGRNVYKGNGFYKYYADFEKNWLSKVNPSPCNGESTADKANKLLQSIKSRRDNI